MAKLSESNPHLQTEAQRIAMVSEQVSRSSAIEGIYISAEEIKKHLLGRAETSCKSL